MREAKKSVRIGAVGDLHCTRNSKGKLQRLFTEMRKECDVVVLCGDLTDFGLEEEAKILAEELTALQDVPVVGVLGNHDHESNRCDEVKRILCGTGMHVLDGDSCVIEGVGFAGVKGFAGGFDTRSLEPWGETMIKQFVQEAVNESLKLESALSRLRAQKKIVVLHYSPIKATVEGEAPEILPFLGSRRLEEPLTRFPVDCVFHGHAHSGSPEGSMKNGIPVFNVAMPMLMRRFPGLPPFKQFTVEFDDVEPAGGHL